MVEPPPRDPRDPADDETVISDGWPEPEGYVEPERREGGSGDGERRGGGGRDRGRGRGGRDNR